MKRMNKQKYYFLGLAVFLLMALSSCGVGPTDDDVKKDFLAKYPTAEITSINRGEGDSDSVYVHIKYKHESAGIAAAEDILLYSDKGGPSWELIHIRKETNENVRN
ncbi:MAG: hypothetical protein ACKE8R_05820 [Methylophagaceae bacterium]